MCMKVHPEDSLATSTGQLRVLNIPLGVSSGGFWCLCVLFVFVFKQGCHFLDCLNQFALRNHDEGLTPSKYETYLDCQRNTRDFNIMTIAAQKAGLFLLPQRREGPAFPRGSRTVFLSLISSIHRPLGIRQIVRFTMNQERCELSRCRKHGKTVHNTCS